MKTLAYYLFVGLLLFGCRPEESSVFFKNIKDGDQLRSPFVMEMGVRGMKVEPAGEVRKGYGHHHLLINQTNWPEGEIIPQSDSTIHYGKGQTESEVVLSKGKYVLTLQFADGVHTSYGPKMSSSVEVYVTE